MGAYSISPRYHTVLSRSSDVKMSPNRMLKRDFKAAGLNIEKVYYFIGSDGDDVIWNIWGIIAVFRATVYFKQ